MSDYISRSALLDGCKTKVAMHDARIARCQGPCYYNESRAINAHENRALALEDMIELISNAPDAEKVGHWLEDGEVQICSECGEEHEWAGYRAPFCDTCGPRMVEGASDNG